MFTTELCLRALPAPDEWALTEPLIWIEGAWQLEIPIGFITDLASIPSLLRSALDVNGRSRRCAVAHDFLYCARYLSRKDSDDFFYRALIAEGVSRLTARVYWSGVRLGGGSHWDTRAPGLRREDFITEAALRAALLPTTPPPIARVAPPPI